MKKKTNANIFKRSCNFYIDFLTLVSTIHLFKFRSEQILHFTGIFTVLNIYNFGVFNNNKNRSNF